MTGAIFSGLAVVAAGLGFLFAIQERRHSLAMALLALLIFNALILGHNLEGIL